MLYIWKHQRGLFSGLFSDAGDNQACRDEIEQCWNSEFPEDIGYCFPVKLPELPPMQSLAAERVDVLVSRGYQVITDRKMSHDDQSVTMQDLVDNYSS